MTRTKRMAGKGFSLIELLIAVVILAVIIQLAIPSMQDFFDRRRVGGAAEAGYTFVQQARSEALKQSSSMRVTAIAGNAGTWWIGIVAGAADCTRNVGAGTSTCQILENNVSVTKILDGALYPGVTLTVQELASPAVASTGITYSERGLRPPPLPTAETELMFTSQRGIPISVRVNQVGNVRLCSDSSTAWGYAKCS